MKKLRGIIILIFVYLLAGESVVCAKDPDFVAVDKETYRLYQEQKWDSLIDMGKEALKQDIDYFYLRYRLGVAYYSKQNFGKAIQHFEKAYDFNKDDRSLLAYLFYANRMLNRKQQAFWYASKLPDQKADQLLNYENQTIEHIDFETAYIFSNDDEKNGRLSKYLTDSSTYLSQQLSGNMVYGNLGIGVKISDRLGLYFGYNYLQLNKKNKYVFNSDLKLDSIVSHPFTDDYFYSYEKEKYGNNAQLYQNEIYTNLDFYLGDGWKMKPAFHYIHVKNTDEKVTYQPEETQAIAYYSKTDSNYYYFNYIKNNYSFTENEKYLNNYVAGLSLSKSIGNLILALEGTISNLNFSKQKQLSFNAIYYPFGNANFYGVTTLSYFNQSIENEGNDRRFLFRQKLGFRVFSVCWIEGIYMHGDLNNTSWNNAFLVYNVPDKINYLTGLNILFPLNETIELSLRYQFRNRSGSYLDYYFDSNGEVKNRTIETDYQNQTIIGGIKWNL